MESLSGSNYISNCKKVANKKVHPLIPNRIQSDHDRFTKDGKKLLATQSSIFPSEYVVSSN